jgi:hypothetical protein
MLFTNTSPRGRANTTKHIPSIITTPVHVQGIDAVGVSKTTHKKSTALEGYLPTKAASILGVPFQTPPSALKKM